MSTPIFLEQPVNLISLGWPYYFAGFFLFAFIGWCGECIYAYYVHHHWVNRGFLNGPVCPIYGVGAMSVTLILAPLQLDSFALFLVGGLLCTVLEYFTGLIMEKIWHLKWWDYSHVKFNIKGYVCLSASIAWGVLCVFLIRLIDPFIFYYMAKIPRNIVQTTVIILFIILTIDLIITVVSSAMLSHNIKSLSDLAEQWREKRAEDEPEHQELKETILSHINHFQKRLLRAFPTMDSIRFSEGMVSIREKIEQLASQVHVGKNDKENEPKNDKKIDDVNSNDPS